MATKKELQGQIKNTQRQIEELTAITEVGNLESNEEKIIQARIKVPRPKRYAIALQ